MGISEGTLRALGMAVALGAFACNLLVGEVERIDPPSSGGGGQAGGGAGTGAGGDLLADGAACDDSAACASGQCVDGVCCGDVCDGSCEGCSQALTGQPDGTCAAYLGDDPEGECSERMVCGPSGACEHGVVRWALRFGDAALQTAEAVAVDSQGNIVVVGSMEGMVDFGPLGCVSDCMSVAAQSDGFVLKLDDEGDFLWAKFLSGSGEDFASDVAIDAQDDIFVVGRFVGQIDLGDTTPLVGAGTDADGFWLKLDATGAHLHSSAIITAGVHRPVQVVLDPLSGASFVASEVFPDPQPNEDGDTHVVKLDADGGIDWEVAVTGDRNTPLGIGERGGSLYVLMRVRDTAQFPAPVGAYVGPTTPEAVLWMMTDAASTPGNHVVASYGGSDVRSAGAVAMPSDGVILGLTSDAEIGFPGPAGPLTGLSQNDLALGVLDNTGVSCPWRLGLSDDNDTQEWGGVAVDELDGAIVGVGYNNGTLLLGPGIMAAGTANDVFVLRLSDTGVFVWARGYGDDLPQRALDVALEPAGDIVIVGEMQGTLDFGGAPLSASGADAFVVMLSP